VFTSTVCECYRELDLLTVEDEEASSDVAVTA